MLVRVEWFRCTRGSFLAGVDVIPKLVGAGRGFMLGWNDESPIAMGQDPIDRIETASKETRRTDETPGEFVRRVGEKYGIDSGLTEEVITYVNAEGAKNAADRSAALEPFCDRLTTANAETADEFEQPRSGEETSESASESPSLADRIEESDDFRSAIEQSTDLVVGYRKIVIALGLLLAIVVAFRYLGFW